jgi:hypothetical protein
MELRSLSPLRGNGRDAVLEPSQRAAEPGRGAGQSRTRLRANL